MDWPIGYKDLDSYYDEAEKELGVSADVDEQTYCGIEFPPESHISDAENSKFDRPTSTSTSP